MDIKFSSIGSTIRITVVKNGIEQVSEYQKSIKNSKRFSKLIKESYE